jgi:hemerythrin
MMSLIEWDDTFHVGVTEIDRQHQILVSMINRLNYAMKKGKGKDVIGDIIGGLINYTVFHFETEEKYFDIYRYPGTGRHKEEHADFIQSVSGFNDEYTIGKLSLTIDVMNFLGDWLGKHIKGTDMQYSQFFIGKGLN